MGMSPQHASTVPLVLNLTTGHLSPQFHVVFDDWFTTVDSTELNPNDSMNDEVWQELFANERFLAHFDDEDPVDLDDEWLTELERIERHEKAASKVQANMPAEPALPADLPRLPSKRSTPLNEKPSPEQPAGLKSPEGAPSMSREKPPTENPTAPSIMPGSKQSERRDPSTVVPPRRSIIGGAPSGRNTAGTRLLESARADGTTVCRESIRTGAPLSNGRSRSLPSERQSRVPGPS